MKTSKQLRNRRRILNGVALLCVYFILALANFGGYILGGIWLVSFTALFSVLVLFNFPYYKFK